VSLGAMTKGGGNRGGTLALVGGGRWARVIASVLSGLDTPFAHVLIVSRANAGFLAQNLPSSRFEVVPTIDEALRRFRPNAAIIANAARAHVSNAERLIAASVPVLIEKPAALKEEEAARLLASAKRHGVCAMACLPLLHCSYLHRFIAQLAASGLSPENLTLEWEDAAGETRYGEPKRYDGGISVAQDVMPHAWAILSQVFGASIDADAVRACGIVAGGRGATYALEVGGGRAW
jgi:predicted dehydrogenase